jgi:hypothetical protein
MNTVVKYTDLSKPDSVFEEVMACHITKFNDNDFLVIDTRTERTELPMSDIRSFSDREFIDPTVIAMQILNMMRTTQFETWYEEDFKDFVEGDGEAKGTSEIIDNLKLMLKGGNVKWNDK